MALRAFVANDLVRTLAARRVLDGVSLVAAPGDRVGLIGENGSGKTTLLRLLAGADEPDAGGVERLPDIGFLEQELPFDPGATVQQVVEDALSDSRSTLHRLDGLAEVLSRDPDDAHPQPIRPPAR